MNLLPRSMRTVCGVAAAGALSVSVAFAATPSEGTIGSSAPKVEWAGELIGSGVFYNAWVDDPTVECSSPACDPFALKIADGPHPVTIKLNINSTNADGSDPGAGIRIKFPDGSYQYSQGTASETTAYSVKLKSAPAGDYVIDVVASHVCCATDPYNASAEIVGATTAPAPGTTTATPPTAGPLPT